MAGCNWAFGVAIVLFVVTLILILVIVMGGSDDGNEKIIVMPPGPTSAAAVPVGVSSKSALASGNRAEMGKVRELASAAEALKLLKGEKPALVLFYANFCGHCKKMMPDFEQAAMIGGAKTGLIIARVESGSLKDMAAMAGKLPEIKGFPTAVSNYEGAKGELHPHVGRMDKGAIESLMQKAASRASGSHANRASSCGGGGGSVASMVRAEEGATAPYSRDMKEFQSWQDVCDALQSDTKTIVMAYADWCGYCKAMMPDYEKLLRFAPRDVVVGRINANLITHAEVCNGPRGNIDVLNGYPTILFNGSKGKKILKVVGKKDIKTLVQIVQEKKDV
jgi:thiol-disulfide isomerase/thioredoxin